MEKLCQRGPNASGGQRPGGGALPHVPPKRNLYPKGIVGGGIVEKSARGRHTSSTGQRRRAGKPAHKETGTELVEGYQGNAGDQ